MGVIFSVEMEISGRQAARETVGGPFAAVDPGDIFEWHTILDRYAFFQF
jgi:hypothetical protein